MGDINTFDALVLSATELEVDESNINGETDLMKKTEAIHFSEEECPFIVSGTSIVNGNGTILVLAIGPNSFEGKIKTLMNSEDEEKTPL